MSDYKKIIFLDIDGVLAGIEFLHNRSGSLIDPEKCKLLNQLGDIGVEVVISSSWGEDGGRTEKSLRGCGLTLPIIGYTDHFHIDYLCRGNEIEKWICEHLAGMGTKYYQDDDGTPYYQKHHHAEDIDYEYVIFDDDSDMLYGQKDNFIKVNDYTGITQDDIDNARKILTRQ